MTDEFRDEFKVPQRLVSTWNKRAELLNSAAAFIEHNDGLKNQLVSMASAYKQCADEVREETR